VVEFEPQRAKRSLPRLLRTAADRRVARAMLDNIEAHFALDERQRELVAELRALLPATPAANGARLPAPSGRKRARTRARASA